jgi:hypothetical protein
MEEEHRSWQRITLCGSLRFEKQFKQWNERLSLEGNVVYTVAVYPSDKDGVKDWYAPMVKAQLDLVHLRKIENSDAILVIDLAQLSDVPYIGESTAREINYAKGKGKGIIFLSDVLKAQALATEEDC